MTTKSLQDKFINACIARKTKCNVYLINGIKLNGVLVAADQYTVMLQLETQSQLIYKHAVSTIVPSDKLAIGDLPGDESDGAAKS